MSIPRVGERARKSLREVGGIVLGVLIALGIGEVADSARHRLNARRALDAVRTEIGLNAPYLEERLLKGHCLDQRLGQIRSELAAARRSGRLSQISAVGRPNIRPFRTARWSGAAGGGEMLYANSDEVNLLAQHYSSLESYISLGEQEQLVWARLRALENAPGPISDDLLGDMITTAEEARYLAQVLTVIAGQLQGDQKDLGVKVQYYDDMPRSKMVADSRSNPMCQPLSGD